MRIRVHVPAPTDHAAERQPRSPLEAVLEERGRELDAEVRADFESRFQHDLGHIRVHTGPTADAAARRMDARALAIGGHLVFAAGEFQPGSVDGRRLLAHEIAHAIQGSNALRVDALAAAECDVAPRAAAAAGRAGARWRPACGRRSRAAGTPGRADRVPAWPASADSIHGWAHVADHRRGRLGLSYRRDARLAATATGTVDPCWSQPRCLRGRPDPDPSVPGAAPVRDVAAPQAEAMVELIALDIARALETDPADGAGVRDDASRAWPTRCARPWSRVSTSSWARRSGNRRRRR